MALIGNLQVAKQEKSLKGKEKERQYRTGSEEKGKNQVSVGLLVMFKTISLSKNVGGEGSHDRVYINR